MFAVAKGVKMVMAASVAKPRDLLVLFIIRTRRRVWCRFNIRLCAPVATTSPAPCIHPAMHTLHQKKARLPSFRPACLIPSVRPSFVLSPLPPSLTPSLRSFFLSVFVSFLPSFLPSSPSFLPSLLAYAGSAIANNITNTQLAKTTSDEILHLI